MEGTRPATVADAARLAELHTQAREHMVRWRGGDLFLRREARPEPVEDGLVAAIDGSHTKVVAGTIDDVVVGYGVGRIEDLRDGGRLGVIEDLFVEEGARGVAVGETMMGDLMTWFAQEGCLGVDAFALPGDRETKNFFETFGFKARLLRVHHRFDAGDGEESTP